VRKYNIDIDRESAFELLEQKINRAEAAAEAAKRQPIPSVKPKGRPVQETSIIEELSKNTMVRQIGRSIFRELTRGILGSFSGSKRR
jgi:hypothetical protein